MAKQRSASNIYLSITNCIVFDTLHKKMKLYIYNCIINTIKNDLAIKIKALSLVFIKGVVYLREY